MSGAGLIYESCWGGEHGQCHSAGCQCECHIIDETAFQEAFALTGSTAYAMEYAHTVARTDQLRRIREHRQ